MSTELKSIHDALQALVVRVEALLGPAITPTNVGTDDPATTPLSPDGLWVPPLLAELAARAKAKYPNGVADTSSFDFRTLRWGAKKVAWPEGLYASACIYKPVGEGGGLVREDLTFEQRTRLHFYHNESLPLAIIDGGSALLFRSIPDAVESGPYKAMIPVTYTVNIDRLWRDLRNHFANIGIVESAGGA